MGREIRRVPPNWEHPRDYRGEYKPLYDRDYNERAARWEAECVQWAQGTHPDQQGPDAATCRYFWDWDGDPPDQEYYRPAWAPEEATAYQIYETVSEGTPISPVFATLDDLQAWLVRQGYSAHAAAEFARTGWVPSLLMQVSRTGATMAEDIHSFDLLATKDEREAQA